MTGSHCASVATEDRELAVPNEHIGHDTELFSPPPPLDTPGGYGSEEATLKEDPITPHTRPKSSRRPVATWVVICLAVLTILAATVTVPVLLTHFLSRKQQLGAGAPSSSTSPDAGPPTPGGALPTSGTNGSLVHTEQGETFIYINPFGGDWAADPKDPFAPGGKAQSWSKRIGTEEWVWGTDVVRGVNLGGWLVTEPFIVPALYEKYATLAGRPIYDEWDLCIAMGNNVIAEMEYHYATFITEGDFAEIAAAGLNWVRVPIGFWAIETAGDEPFLEHSSWTYFLKAIQWARKYGLRVYLDLHALPGSQNGWNHSGKGGSVNFMNGVMGIANAQRTLTYIRILTEFVSQKQYRDVVCILGIVNEILWGAIGKTSIESFYYAAYQTIRGVTGFGAGAGPYIAMHEGFQGLKVWEGFLAGSDRVILDQHPYLAFWKTHAINVDEMVRKPCDWAVATNRSSNMFGVTLGGEFSAAVNDCGLWVAGVGSMPSYGDCSLWDNWEAYDQATIDTLRNVTLASMDALQNFFFWTWKIGNSTALGQSSSPMWHYKLGLRKGWVPKDPRDATGHCASVIHSSEPFTGHPVTATGGAGAGTLSANHYAFPPPTLSPSFSNEQMSLLPTYTPTGTVKTLFAPTFTAAPSATVGNGWQNSSDKSLAYVPVKGCAYPNAWDAVHAPLPPAPCAGN